MDNVYVFYIVIASWKILALIYLFNVIINHCFLEKLYYQKITGNRREGKKPEDNRREVVTDFEFAVKILHK